MPTSLCLRIMRASQPASHSRSQKRLNEVWRNSSMAEARVAPYGSWKSPITADLIVKGSIGLGQPAIDGEDVYWIELRPSEGGRSVIVRRGVDGQTTDVT